jgi:hypothetical protein
VDAPRGHRKEDAHRYGDGHGGQHRVSSGRHMANPVRAGRGARRAEARRRQDRAGGDARDNRVR